MVTVRQRSRCTRPLSRSRSVGARRRCGARAAAPGHLSDGVRDELTGLPTAALNDTLKATGRRYTIAMIDVDRFKDVNDAHGHQVGDEVLRMVASRLARVGGGGRVFRYGGEEFTVVFSGKDPSDALPHLEALRVAIEGYRLAIRAPNRFARQAAGQRRRGGTLSAKTVSVTVSIGVAAHEVAERVPGSGDRGSRRGPVPRQAGGAEQGASDQVAA
jgi:diguanylate cyclase (GGDEF)-like protein